jgi:O-antigen/teichoic acid export membrane protein
MSIDVVLLGALASTSVVTVYVLSAHATQIWLSAISLGLGAVTPGLGSLIGSRDFARAAEMRAELLRMVWLLAVTAGSVILLWNPSFVRLWIGQGHFAGTSVNLLLVLLMTQLCIARADSYIIDVTLQMRDKVYVGFVAAAVSALAAAALIPSYKILGLCAGLLLGRLVLSISYPILISRQFGRNGMLRPSSGIRPAMATCILFGGCAILGSNLQANSWLLFLIGAPLSAWAIVVLAMRAGLDSHQRSVLLQRLRKLRLRETGKGSTVT